MRSAPYLTIIIPAYNEEQRLPDTLEQVHTFLAAQPYPSELLVVENGSQDRTADIALEFMRRAAPPGSAGSSVSMDLLREPRRGKGLAIRRGMLAAHGQFRFMCDSDHSMPIDQVSRFLAPALVDFDIAIGSREAPGAIRYDEPHYRHLGGRFVNSLIRLMALPGLQDTQCGFKCFRSEAAEVLFGLQTLQGWSFDIEILYLARLKGYRIVEIPIPWYFNPETKLNPFRDAVRMAMDILVVRRNARLGAYD